MPNSSRQKGDRFEREVVAYLLERGIPAERIPLSGASPFGSFSGYDLSVTVLGNDLRAECKISGQGFRTIYKWLDHGDNQMLIIRANRSKPLAVIPLDLLVDLVTDTKIADNKKRIPKKPGAKLSQDHRHDVATKSVKRTAKRAPRAAKPNPVRSAGRNGRSRRVP